MTDWFVLTSFVGVKEVEESIVTQVWGTISSVPVDKATIDHEDSERSGWYSNVLTINFVVSILVLFYNFNNNVICKIKSICLYFVNKIFNVEFNLLNINQIFVYVN